jgi:hypothetical protein
MRKYRHTALIIILAIATRAHGQDSGVFSNYFAVKQQGEWCHSGRIERCLAAGIAVREPTFWDYWLGKNHAKLLNVKADIKRCIQYYVKPVANVLDVLRSDGIAGLIFSNEAHFLTYCGLATNALDETPYFKSQYPSVTGGWQNVMVMVTNMTKTLVSDYFYDLSHANTNIYAWVGEGYSNTYLNCLPLALNDYHEDLFYYGGADAWQYNYVDTGVDRYIQIGRSMTISTFPALPAPYESALSVFASVDKYYDIGEFYGWGDFATNSYYEITNMTVTSAAYSVVYGSTNMVFDSGPSIDAQADTFYGYRYTIGRLVYDWTATTNGFKYK